MTNDFDEAEDEFPDDPILQLQADIGDRLATLSEQPEAPDEFEHVGGSFAASEVDFTSSSVSYTHLDVYKRQ